jgi:hypothetical protein
MDKEQRDWHRLFGLILTDFFSGSPFQVELEKDLSLKKQLLDVVILRREGGTFNERLPDGLEELAEHHLITFLCPPSDYDEVAECAARISVKSVAGGLPCLPSSA